MFHCLKFDHICAPCYGNLNAFTSWTAKVEQWVVSTTSLSHIDVTREPLWYGLVFYEDRNSESLSLHYKLDDGGKRVMDRDNHSLSIKFLEVWNVRVGGYEPWWNKTATPESGRVPAEVEVCSYTTKGWAATEAILSVMDRLSGSLTPFTYLKAWHWPCRHQHVVLAQTFNTSASWFATCLHDFSRMERNRLLAIGT